MTSEAQLSMARQLASGIAVFLGMSLFFGLLMLAVVFPFHPVTWLGWLAWFAGAFPLYIAFEALGALFFHERLSRAIDPGESRVSVPRMVYGIVAAVVSLTLCFIFFGVAADIGGDFWAANFSREW